MYDVQKDIAILKSLLKDFRAIKHLDDPETSPIYQGIRVLESLSSLEQESLAQRVPPSDARAEQISTQLGIDRKVYDKAIQGYLKRLPDPQRELPVDGMNDEPMFRAIAKLNEEEREKHRQYAAVKDIRKEDILTCPCCGFRTISEVDDVCPICWWGYDPYQLYHPDSTTGANDVTLRQAQKNYEKLGACDTVFLKSVRKPPDGLKRDPKWKPLS